MQTQIQGHNTNKQDCQNHGYQILEANKQYWNFKTDSWKGYGSNSRCYWQFYAPGSKRLRIRLSVIDVSIVKDKEHLKKFFFLNIATNQYHTSLISIRGR